VRKVGVGVLHDAARVRTHVEAAAGAGGGKTVASKLVSRGFGASESCHSSFPLFLAPSFARRQLVVHSQKRDYSRAVVAAGFGLGLRDWNWDLCSWVRV
jgi:hypothetical protein